MKKHFQYLLILLLLMWCKPAFTQDAAMKESKILTAQDSIKQAVTDTLKVKMFAVKDTAESMVDKANSNIRKLGAPPLSQIISAQKLLWSAIFLLIGYIFIRVLIRLINFFAEKSAKYRITLKGLIPVVKISGWMIIIFIIIKDIIQPPEATFIAVSASIGVAIGFASQDILKNVFGGIIILLERPFNVGDKIEVSGHYGEVIEVGLRSTRIVTSDDSVIVIPNGELMSTSISNSNSGEPNCQVVAEIYLPIDVNTTEARRIALEAAKVSRFVYLNKPVVVLFFNEIKERRSYLKMRVKAYVFDIRDEFAFKSDMTEIVIREFLAEGLIKKEEMF